MFNSTNWTGEKIRLVWEQIRGNPHSGWVDCLAFAKLERIYYVQRSAEMLVCNDYYFSSFCNIAFYKSVQELLRNMGGFKGMKTEGLAITLNQYNFFLRKEFFDLIKVFSISEKYSLFSEMLFLWKAFSYLRVQMKIIFTFCFHDALSHFLETCSNVLHLWASTSIQKWRAKYL